MECLPQPLLWGSNGGWEPSLNQEVESFRSGRPHLYLSLVTGQSLVPQARVKATEGSATLGLKPTLASRESASVPSSRHGASSPRRVFSPECAI